MTYEKQSHNCPRHGHTDHFIYEHATGEKYTFCIRCSEDGTQTDWMLLGQEVRPPEGQLPTYLFLKKNGKFMGGDIGRFGIYRYGERTYVCEFPDGKVDGTITKVLM